MERDRCERRRDLGTDNGANNRVNNHRAKAELKKFENIKANREAASIGIPDSEIADTMGDYYQTGKPKKSATKKGQYRIFSFPSLQRER